MSETSKSAEEIQLEQQEQPKSPGTRGRKKNAGEAIQKISGEIDFSLSPIVAKSDLLEVKRIDTDDLRQRVYNLEQAFARLAHVAGGAHIADKYNIKRN